MALLNPLLKSPWCMVALIALLAGVGCTTSPKQAYDAETDWRTNPAGYVDRMVVVNTSEGWSAGQAKRVAVMAGGGLVLDDPPGPRYPRSGVWDSPVYETDFPITEVLPSWNVDAPANSGVKFYIRSRSVGGGDWSPWLYIGSWGRTLPRDRRLISFDGGWVQVDYLTLTDPADAYQVRAVLQSFDVLGEANPSIRRLTMVYSGVVEDPIERDGLARPVKIEGDWTRTLDVPFLTQADAPPALKPRICSPTSVTMVMRYRGDSGAMVENALAIYDPEYEIFGNWGRAVAYAGQHGFDAYLDRIRTWDQVKAYIARGQPIIASIRFESGTFPSNVLDQTDGHLVVIRGLTPEGDAVMNDSASKERGRGVVYRSDELARAWLRHGGVAYIIRPREADNPAQPAEIGR
jgi:Peptidase_C39 like family